MTRAFGMLTVATAAALWSTAGFFVRLIDLDVWSVLGWRSFFAALSLLAIVVYQNGRRAPRALIEIGLPGLLAIPIAVMSMICYVVALKLTTVANVMIVYATVPFIAAGVSYVWIGERVTSTVLLASTVALVGIVIMAGAASRPQDISGNTLALLMTLTFAVQLVMARRYRSLDMASVNAIAAAISALLCWPLAAGGMPTPADLILLAIFGLTSTALAYLLFLIGARYIPSSEAGLIGLIEVVLGPLWVWLAFAEQPGTAAIIGGSVVLASVVWYLWASRVPGKAMRPAASNG